jgi:predicted nucleic-acid-binding Zn-ribbon protein
MEIPTCPNCKGRELYKAKRLIGSGGGGHAPNYLPGLGSSFLFAAKLEVVVCQDCGLTRFFAAPEARQKLSTSAKWERA